MTDDRNQIARPFLSEEELETRRARLKLNIFRQLRALFRKLQQDKKLTQKELARRLNVDEALISKRLRGEANFTIDTLCDLARGMDARLDVRVVPLDELHTQSAATRTKSGTQSQMLAYPTFLSEPQSNYKGAVAEWNPFLEGKAPTTSHSISASGPHWFMSGARTNIGGTSSMFGTTARAQEGAKPDFKTWPN